MEKFNFIHLSDLHLTTNPKAQPNYPLVEKTGQTPETQLEEIFTHIKTFYGGISFLVITGDLVYNGTLEEYRSLKTYLQETWGDLPIYTCPGNHDIRENYQAFFGGPNKTYESIIDPATGIELISLDVCQDNSIIGTIGEDQLDFLRDKLSRKAPKGRFVLFHQPPWAGLTFLPADLEKFQKALEGADVTALLSGHIHSNMATVFAGIPSYTVGSTAMGYTVVASQKRYTNALGFNYCVVDDSGLKVNTIPFRLGEPASIIVG